MAASVNLDLDPIFLKGLGYLHSKSKDSADKLRALLDESLSGRGSDSSYRSTQKEVEVTKVSSVSKISLSKQDSKSSSSSSSSSSSKSSSSEKNKKEVEKRSSEKVRVEPGEGPEPLKKPRLEPKQQENRSSPVTVQPFRDIPLTDFSNFDAETNADDFAMEMGLACVVCRQMTVTSGNQLVECQECHNLYHQDCHKPQVTDKDVNDPRLVWYCARCTRQMKRMAQKTQKPPQKPAPAVVSAAPVMKDPLVKKPELKVKPDTASTFQAFKRTEVKTSAAVLANPSASGTSLQSGSGLTGWAAFGAKTSPAGPGASAKPSSSGPSGGSKSSPATTPPAQKPAGLLGLTGSKSGGGPVGGGTKAPGGNGNNGNGGNGSGSSSLKPPPPLTLGKQTLIRSSSGENQGRGTSPGSSPSGSQTGLGGNGGGPAGNGGGNGNGSKGASATSQESQLNAMKRLQMVKKKAAQKKLKK